MPSKERFIATIERKPVDRPASRLGILPNIDPANAQAVFGVARNGAVPL